MKIGIIVGSTDISKFNVAIDPSKYKNVKIGSIVKFEVDGKEAYGIITNITIKSTNPLDIASEYSSLELFVQKLKGVEQLILAEVKVLGVLDEKKRFRKLDFPPLPGTDVFLASEEEIKEIYGISEEKWKYITVGKILGGYSIEPALDKREIIIKHLAVFGVTGSGKSHTIAVLTSKLLEHGIPVVIFDVHRDYIPTFKDPIIITFDEREKRYLERFHKDRRGDSNPKIEIVKLKLYEIASYLPDILGISPQAHPYLYLLLDAALKNKPVSLADLKETIKDKRKILGQLRKEFVDPRMLEELDKKFDSARASLITRLHRLEKWKIVPQSVKEGQYLSIDDIIKLKESEEILEVEGEAIEASEGFIEKGKPLIVDLFPLSLEEQRVLIDIFLNKLFEYWKELKKENRHIPIVIVIEEAHRFAAKDVKVSKMLGTIAREGRKFGIGLWLVSQIPSKISEDIISQINTFIFLRLTNPKDLTFIRKSCPYLSEEYLETITKFDRGEALIVGLGVRQPVLVKIEERAIIGGSEKEIEDKLKELYESSSNRGG